MWAHVYGWGSHASLWGYTHHCGVTCHCGVTHGVTCVTMGSHVTMGSYMGSHVSSWGHMSSWGHTWGYMCHHGVTHVTVGSYMGLHASPWGHTHGYEVIHITGGYMCHYGIIHEITHGVTRVPTGSHTGLHRDKPHKELHTSQGHTWDHVCHHGVTRGQTTGTQEHVVTLRGHGDTPQVGPRRCHASPHPTTPATPPPPRRPHRVVEILDRELSEALGHQFVLAAC